MSLRYVELEDRADDRGSSFGMPDTWLPRYFALRGAHLTTLVPGRVRGEHFHRQRTEILIVMADDRWSLHWDELDCGRTHQRSFGRGAVMVHIPAGVSHAIRNDGSANLHIVGLTDEPFDPEAPDVFPRKVTPP